GDHELQAVGNGNLPVFYHDVSLALKVIGGNQVIPDSQLPAKLAGVGFFGQKGIGTSLKNVAFAVFGANHAAQASGFFQQSPFQVGAIAPRLFQVPGCAQAGDASADNGNTLHACGPEVTGNWAEASWAKAEINVGETFKDSVRQKLRDCSWANCLKPMSTS